MKKLARSPSGTGGGRPGSGGVGPRRSGGPPSRTASAGPARRVPAADSGRCGMPARPPPAPVSPSPRPSAARPAFGTHVDDPVGGLDHVQVVLDDQDRVALVDERLQHPEQLVHVLEVQAGRRLVQHVDRAPGRALLQLRRELDPLGLAAGQGRRRLPEPDIAEPDVDESVEVASDLADRPEELAPPRRSASPAPRRSSCPCSAPRASRGCTGHPCRPRRARRRPAGSSSRS